MQDEPRRISTPCVQVCQIESGYCRGCGRDLAEIATWSRMSEAERLRIMREELPRRPFRPPSAGSQPS